MKHVRSAIAWVSGVGVVACLLLGVLWSQLAPRQRWVVYPQADPAAMPTESMHRFTSIGLFGLGAIVIGIVLAVAAWQIRFARGIPMLVALGTSLLVGSAGGLLLGRELAGGVLPVDLPKPSAPTLVTMPPGMTWLLVIVAPLFAVVTYTIAAFVHPDAELGVPPTKALTATT